MLLFDTLVMFLSLIILKIYFMNGSFEEIIYSFLGGHFMVSMATASSIHEMFLIIGSYYRALI